MGASAGLHCARQRSALARTVQTRVGRGKNMGKDKQGEPQEAEP